VAIYFDLSELSMSMANEVRAKLSGLVSTQNHPFVALVYPRWDFKDEVVRTKILVIPWRDKTEGDKKKLKEKLSLMGTYSLLIDPKKGNSELLCAMPLDIPLKEEWVTEKTSAEIEKAVRETRPVLLYS